MLAQTIRKTFVLLIMFTIITGVIYPLFITGIAEMVFPDQSQGSLIYQDGNPVGSVLIGQWFTDSKYFFPRLSATHSYPYNGTYSGGSNYSVLNSKLVKNAEDRFIQLNVEAGTKVPSDLVTSSASGLDPHISIASAELQKPRIAKARNISEVKVEQLIQQNTTQRILGVLGEPCVNVLKLNLALDALE